MHPKIFAPCYNTNNKQLNKNRLLVNKNGLLYRPNDGIRLNADVNGALQIVKKVVPNAFADGIEGVVLRPIMVAPTRNACAGLAGIPTNSPRRELA